MHINQRGEGKAGCILSLLIFAAIAYACFVAVPALYKATAFRDDTEKYFRTANSKSYTEETIRRDVLKMAVDYDQPVTPEEIAITKGANVVTLDIHYKQDLDFKVYKYTRDIHMEFKEDLRLRW